MIDRAHATLVLDDLKRKLSLLEGAYLKSKKLTTGEEWAKKRDAALFSVAAAINDFDGKEATMAVYVLGQVKQILNELHGPAAIIEEFEATRRSAQEIQDALDAEEKEE